MKAEPADRLHGDSAGGRFPTRYILLIAAIIVALALFWTSGVDEESDEQALEPEAVSRVVVPDPLPQAPDIPVRPEPMPEPAVETLEPVAPLPPLEESDPLVREQLSAVGAGQELDKLAGSDNLVQLGAALVDSFSRGLVMRKLLPLDPPAEAFGVAQDGDQMFMDPAGYERYDDYTKAIANLDGAAVVNSFHLLRPLYEQAYGQLGLKSDNFDNAVIRMLDRVLATPEIEQPIELTRKSVMYQYADPALEQLSPVQKQLLRMGPENIRLIKEQARLIRAGLLQAE